MRHLVVVWSIQETVVALRPVNLFVFVEFKLVCMGGLYNYNARGLNETKFAGGGQHEPTGLTKPWAWLATNG